MKWVTRERVKVDRVACPWLIRKFVDPEAEFYFVPADRVLAEAERLGDAYHEHRCHIMHSRQLGLTKTYNLFHNPQCVDVDVIRMRELHAAIDCTVLACYGWTDIDPPSWLSPKRARPDALHHHTADKTGDSAPPFGT